MLSQELSGAYKVATPKQVPSQPTFPLNMGQKSGYSPVHLHPPKVSCNTQEKINESPSATVEGQTTTSPR